MIAVPEPPAVAPHIELLEPVGDSWREATQAMADDLFAAVGSGAVKIRIDQRYPLADAAQAHRELEARKTTGSSVLLP